MKVAHVIVKKIFSLFFGIIALFKRLMCRIRRGRKSSGTILPVVTDHIVSASVIQQSVPSNDVELESWDNWGMDGQPAGSIDTNNHIPGTANSHSAMYRGNKEPEAEPDVDFFSGMTPKVQMNPKIMVRKKENMNYSGGISSRLAMTSEVPVAGGELGSWEESDNAWGDEAVEDLSWEAENAIKEKRRLERERRHIEGQRKRQEKDALKSVRKDSPFSAVKLS